MVNRLDKYLKISYRIMLDKNLNCSQKIILAEIYQLSKLKNGCFANNKHFSDLTGITKENVSRNIKELAKKGYVKIVNNGVKRNRGRNIKIVRGGYQNDKRL